MLEAVESHRATGNLMGNVPVSFQLFSEKSTYTDSYGYRYSQNYAFSEEIIIAKTKRATFQNETSKTSLFFSDSFNHLNTN